MNTYRELIVWQKSMELAVSIYRMTKGLPKEETYGLVSQIRRAAVSIPSNLAEGSKRHNPKEFAHFCAIAKGSAAEVETQLLLIHRIYKIAIDDLVNLLYEVQKMLTSLAKKLQTTNSGLPTGK